MWEELMWMPVMEGREWNDVVIETMAKERECGRRLFLHKLWELRWEQR